MLRQKRYLSISFIALLSFFSISGCSFWEHCLFPCSSHFVIPFDIQNRSYWERCLCENIHGSSHGGRLPRNIDRVKGLETRMIYRSGKLEARFIPVLVDNLAIKTIITLSHVSSETRKRIRERHINHFEFNYRAEQITLDQVEAAVNQILNSPDPILVHCHGGADRTGLVIACLKIRLGKCNLEDLMNEMKIYCHRPRPEFTLYSHTDYHHYRRILETYSGSVKGCQKPF